MYLGKWAVPALISDRMDDVDMYTDQNKWYAEITVQKNKYYSKACNTVEEAVEARKELERKHWQ